MRSGEDGECVGGDSIASILVNLDDDQIVNFSATLLQGDKSSKTVSLPPLHFSVLGPEWRLIETEARGDLLIIDLDTLIFWPSHLEDRINVYQVPPAAASLTEGLVGERGSVPRSQLVRALTELLSPSLFEGFEEEAFAAFRGYISQHLAEAISTEDVASALGMSVFQLREMTKNAAGMTPANWLREARIQFARDLLATTSVAIEQIAERTGYSDRFSFTRAFTSVTGVSPSAYREAAVDNQSVGNVDGGPGF